MQISTIREVRQSNWALSNEAIRYEINHISHNRFPSDLNSFPSSRNVSSGSAAKVREPVLHVPCWGNSGSRSRTLESLLVADTVDKVGGRQLLRNFFIEKVTQANHCWGRFRLRDSIVRLGCPKRLYQQYRSLADVNVDRTPASGQLVSIELGYKSRAFERQFGH